MREGYEETQVANIPDNWKVNKLKKVITINPKKEQIKDEKKEVTFLSMADISNDGRILNRQAKRYCEVNKGFTFFRENDVLLAKITPCFENGKRALATNLLNELGFGSTEFHVLRGNKLLTSNYIYYFIDAYDFKNKAELNMVGSAGQRRVPTDFIKNFTILIPPLREQEKIASILSSVDSHIEETENIIEDLKELKKGLMQKLLTGQYTIEDGKLVKTKEFKKTNLGMIPLGWQVKKIIDICKNVTIGLVKTMTDYYVEIGVPLIRNSDIKENRIDKKSMVFLDEDFARCNESKRLKLGDIVTVHTGDIGTSAVINSEFEGSHGFATLNTKVNMKIVNPYYLCFYFNSNRFKNQAYNVSTGDGRNNLNLKDFKIIEVVYPTSLNEQKKITSILSSVDNRIETYQTENKDLKELKKGLMQQLLTGKVRVKTN